MKNRFYDKYYKFISDDNYVLAVIISHANEGDMLQVITNNKSHYIEDTKSVDISGNVITFNIKQDDLYMYGFIILDELHPLKHKVMGPFSYLPMECKHEIYSMYHNLQGKLKVNDKEIIFDNGIGYIEGDSGKNFPQKYVWYNSVTKDISVTFAIASIPLFGFIHFTGILCFIKSKDKEYRLCTYNGAKLKKIDDKELIIKKGKYTFKLSINIGNGHLLKAPVKGNMVRYIKENLNVLTSYTFTYKDQLIYQVEDPLSSLEYMW